VFSFSTNKQKKNKNRLNLFFTIFDDKLAFSEILKILKHYFFFKNDEKNPIFIVSENIYSFKFVFNILSLAAI